MVEENILITGAGTGFGKEIAFGLAERGKDVIAGVEVGSQVSSLEKEANERNVSMEIEKLDITDPKDREKAWNWDINILVNNAAIKEGGALVDVPEENLRNQFEVNTIAPVLLTQGFAKRMAKKQRGRIVFMSSISGMMVNPFSGPYAASKYALEAFADTLSRELQEFNIEVATINPGPYLTGFNDREFEAWKSWDDDPSERVFDHNKMSFPFEQYNPSEVIEPSIRVILGKDNSYRTVIPEKMIPQVKEQVESLWTKKTDENLGERDPMVQKSYDIEPKTKAEDY